jgi:hypothetical protein
MGGLFDTPVKEEPPKQPAISDHDKTMLQLKSQRGMLSQLRFLADCDTDTKMR